MEFLIALFGIIYIVYRVQREKGQEVKTRTRYEAQYKDQMYLYHRDLSELSEMLNIRISDIPLRNDPNFMIDNVIQTHTAESRRKGYAVAMILQRQGKKFYPKDPLETEGGKDFASYVNGSKMLPMELEKKRDSRFGELNIMFTADRNSFVKLLGRDLLDFSYPFCNSSAINHYKLICIDEILDKEGLYTEPKKSANKRIDSINYGLYGGTLKQRKRAFERAYELYTMKHSDFIREYGSDLPEELLRNRADVIRAIASREGWRFNVFDTEIVDNIDSAALDKAYELLK